MIVHNMVSGLYVHVIDTSILFVQIPVFFNRFTTFRITSDEEAFFLHRSLLAIPIFLIK